MTRARIPTPAREFELARKQLALQPLLVNQTLVVLPAEGQGMSLYIDRDGKPDPSGRRIVARRRGLTLPAQPDLLARLEQAWAESEVCRVRLSADPGALEDPRVIRPFRMICRRLQLAIAPQQLQRQLTVDGEVQCVDVRLEAAHALKGLLSREEGIGFEIHDVEPVEISAPSVPPPTGDPPERFNPRPLRTSHLPDLIAASEAIATLLHRVSRPAIPHGGFATDGRRFLRVRFLDGDQHEFLPLQAPCPRVIAGCDPRRPRRALPLRRVPREAAEALLRLATVLWPLREDLVARTLLLDTPPEKPWVGPSAYPPFAQQWDESLEDDED